MSGKGRRSSKEKVSAHRDRMRKLGMRPLQIWVPDVDSPVFKSEAHRSRWSVARSKHAAEDQLSWTRYRSSRRNEAG